MFTGIVEEIGTVNAITRSSSSMQLVIDCSKVLSDVTKGDSISVNGVCLTVSTYTATHFTADVMPETFQATTLSYMKRGNAVNLERAMLADGRFGGHIVSGHIDSIGKIAALRKKENALYMDIHIDKSLLIYVVPKGSITVDGTSLTVMNVFDKGFTISLIPTTQKDSIIGQKRLGDYVNIECDILAKYMERILMKQETQLHDGLTIESLSINGFLG